MIRGIFLECRFMVFSCCNGFARLLSLPFPWLQLSKPATLFVNAVVVVVFCVLFSHTLQRSEQFVRLVVLLLPFVLSLAHSCHNARRFVA